MEYLRVATAFFDASHQVPDYPGCNALHGHTWTVRAGVDGPLQPDENNIRTTAGYTTLGYDLDRVVEELDARHLNDMLPGTTTIPEAIAAWFLERLPEVRWVEIEMGWRKTYARTTRTRR